MDPRLLAAAPGGRQKQPPQMKVSRRLGLVIQEFYRRRPLGRKEPHCPFPVRDQRRRRCFRQLSRQRIAITCHASPCRSQSRTVHVVRPAGASRRIRRSWGWYGRGIGTSIRRETGSNRVRPSQDPARKSGAPSCTPDLLSFPPVPQSSLRDQIPRYSRGNPAASWRRGCYRVAIVEAGWRQRHASPSTRDWTS